MLLFPEDVLLLSVDSKRQNVTYEVREFTKLPPEPPWQQFLT